MVLAVLVVAGSAFLARFFSTRSETILAAVPAQRAAAVGGGVVHQLAPGCRRRDAGVGDLGLTRVVLSIVGVASIVGLAVGFAFRDITENFIASVLLGVRRPFQIGDVITVAGQAGGVSR